MAEVLSRRALGRAVLERQLLLGRVEASVVATVERLFGLNAQDPNLPYLALASRLEGFAIDDLTVALQKGSVVRSTLMRSTQHVMSVPDFRLVRPALAPLLRRVQRNAFGRRTEGIDLDELVAATVELLGEGRVLTRPQLGRALLEHWPDADPTALGWTAQYLLPLVHPAPSGTWNTRGATPFALADWTGVRPEASAGSLAEMVRRYLSAFGPAGVADVRAWSGVSGLREVVEKLRPALRVYRDESGRELFDLPDTPIPDPDTPAPVRLLPEFDAPLLAYADRTRMMTDQVRRRVCVGAGVAATVLVDGTVAGSWTWTRGSGRTRNTAVLEVRPFRRLSGSDRAAIEVEGRRLLDFAGPDTSAHEVRVLALD